MREHSKYKTQCMYTVLAFFNKFQIHDLGNLVILKFFFSKVENLYDLEVKQHLVEEINCT